MSNADYLVHHTISNRIPGMAGDAWEFNCPICGYRARYIIHRENGGQELEILDSGDPRVRHVGYHMQTTHFDAIVENDDLDDESWLTPALRLQMEELLKDIDFGDEDGP